MLGSKSKCGSTGAGNSSTWRSSRPRSPPCCGKAPSLDDLPFCFDAGPHCATIKIGTSTDPATVSVVLNDVPGRAISQATRDRIKAAAQQFNYRPSFLARSLRNRKTQTIGVLVPELGDGYHTQVMTGIGDHLIDAGYFYFTAHHRHRKNLIQEYVQMLLGRGV